MRRLRHATLAAVAAVGLTACGGATADAPITVDLASAVAATQSHEQAAMVMTMDMTILGQQVSFRAEGVSGLTPTASSQMTMSFGDLPGVPPTMLDGNEMRIVDGVIYQRGGALTQAFAAQMGGKPWVATRLPEAFTAASATSGQDAGAILEMLRLAGSDIEDVGLETIDGVQTRHVTTTVELGAFYDQSGVDMRDMIDAQMATTGQELPDAMIDGLIEGMRDQVMHYDLWVDADSLVRRIRVDADLSGSMGMQPGSADMTMTMELTDYGITTEVLAPPAADVFIAY